MARKKKEAPLAAEPVDAGAEEKAPLASPAVPPLKETHDAVAAVVAKEIPQRKAALTPHVDAVEQMGLGMLRMSLALALLLPFQVFGATKASSSLVAKSDRDLVVFSMSSGRDMSMQMEYDLDSPCEVGRISVLAPNKSAGTAVTLKRKWPYSLPYVTGRTYSEFAVGPSAMTPGSYRESVGPAVWLTYIDSASPYTNLVVKQDVVFTNRADGAVSTNSYFAKDSIGLARLTYAVDSTWGTGPYLQATLKPDGGVLMTEQRLYYSISSNAVFSGALKHTKTWTYLGTKGGSSPFQTVGSVYWPDNDSRILYCPAWRDGDFEWVWTNSNYFAMRDGEFLPMVTNRITSSAVMVDAYCAVLKEIVAERTYDPFRVLFPVYEDPSLSVATYTGYPQYSEDYDVADLTNGVPVDVWGFTPRHDASYVANWGARTGTQEETVRTFSLTNGLQTVDFGDLPVVLMPGDVLTVSGGVTSNDAYRVTFTGRR